MLGCFAKDNGIFEIVFRSVVPVISRSVAPTEKAFTMGISMGLVWIAYRRCHRCFGDVSTLVQF